MDLVTILEGLMTPSTTTIGQAQNDIIQAFRSPETYGQLFNVMAHNQKSSIRQYAALLLRKQLCIEYNYEQVPFETRLSMKSTLLSIIAKEPVRCVRANMAELLGYVFVHENSYSRLWIDQSLQKIVEWLQSPIQSTIELGAFVLLKIAEIAADLFLERFKIIGQVFEATLLAAAADFELPPRVLQHILTTMSLVPAEMSGFTEVENFYQAAVPHLVSMLKKMSSSKSGGSNFTAAVEIFSNMLEYTPGLLDNNLKMLVDLMLSVSRDSSCEEEWRTCCLMWLCLLVNNRNSLIIRLELVEPIVANVFDILSTEPESEDPNEFLTNSERNTPLAAANIVIDTVALQIPAKIFFDSLLKLLEEALGSTLNPLRRRAAFIVMATIAEGCRDAICDKHLPSMVGALKEGLSDVMSSVRNAALYAIGQFCEYLQPEFVELSRDMLPILITYAQSAVQVSATGHLLDVKSTERLFYALETFCCSSDQDMSPFVNELIKLIFALLQGTSVVAKIQAINLLKAVANADCQRILPWLGQLMQKLRAIIMHVRPSKHGNDAEELRLRALDALAEIIRSLTEYKLPYAQESMRFGLQWLQQTEDVDERRSLLNFMGAWATYVGEDFAQSLPVVMQSIEICLTSATGHGAGGDRNTSEVTCLTECDDSDMEQCPSENPYTEAKEQALHSIVELTEACPVAFLAHAKVLFDRLFKHTENASFTICKISFKALNAVAIVLFTSEPYGGGRAALSRLLSHYIDVVTGNFEGMVVVEALKSLGEIMIDIEGNIFANARELQDSIARCIFRGLKFEYNCQRGVNLTYDINYKDKDVIKNVFYLLECFGQAIRSAEFAVYFAEMETLLLMHIQSANSESHESLFASMIGSLAEYYKPLRMDAQHYFFRHYQLLMNASQQRGSSTLRNAIHGLGQLFYYAGEVACSHYAELLDHLSHITATEPKRFVMQSVVATLARLVLKNVHQVPLEQVLPFLTEKLAIISGEEDNEIVMRCLEFLFDRFPEPMRYFITSIVAKAVNNLAYESESTAVTKTTVELLRKIRRTYPADYQRAMLASNLEEAKKFARQRVPPPIFREIL